MASPSVCSPVGIAVVNVIAESAFGFTPGLQFRTVDEINRTDHAEERPQIVPSPLLAHEEDHERNEYRYRYDLLDDLQLGYVQASTGSNPVRGDRYRIFDKGDKPAHEDDRDEWP